MQKFLKDAQGHPVSAAVEIRDHATGKIWKHDTGPEGSFIEPILPPGQYDVAVHADSYTDYLRKGVPLAVGQKVSLKIALSQEAESVETSATGETSRLSLDSGAISVAVGKEEMRDLPLNGRSFEQLALLQPGITAAYAAGSSFYGARTRAISINGARPEQNSFLLDGADVMNSFNKTPGSAAGTLLGVDGVLEYQVLTNAFSPEFGRAAGGVVNAATLSGTNQIHAGLFYFLRNSALDAKNYFNPPGQNIPGFKRNQFGGVVGGALRKNRTFFFGSFENLTERLGVISLTAVPDSNARLGILASGNVQVNAAIQPYLNALFPLPNGRSLGNGIGEYNYSLSQPSEDRFYQTRIDHRTSDRASLFVRYTLDDGSVDRVPVGGLPVARLSEQTRNQYATFSYVTALTPALFDTVHLDFSRSAATAINDRTLPGIDSLSFLPGAPFGYITITGVTSSIGGDARVPRQDYFNNFQFSDTLLWVHGRHTLHMGFSGERQQFNTINTIQQGGAVVFSNLSNFLLAKPSSIDFSIPGAYDPERGFRQTLAAAYIADDFRVRENLTFNFGLRWEFATVPTEANGKISNLRNISDTSLTVGDPYFNNPEKKNFAPRGGFAWSPGKNGKTVIRAGYGLFYDLVLPRSYFIVATRNPPYSNRVLVNNPPFPVPSSFLAGLNSVPRSVNSFAPDFENPYMSQFNLSLNRSWMGWNLSATYVGTRGFHLTRQAETNLSPSTLVNGVKTYQPQLGRQNAAFASIIRVELDARSFYNALQFMAVKDLRHGLRAQVSYTWQKSVDDASGIVSTDFTNTVQYTMDYLDRRADRGLSSFDTPHVLVANWSWQLPGPGSRGGHWSSPLRNWQLHNITTIQAGQPFTVQMGFNRSGNLNTASLTANDRPDLNPSFQGNPILGDPRHYWDINYVQMPAANQRGNLGRNTLMGPGLLTVDLAAVKRVRIRERSDLQFRAEVFNVTNTPNFATPTGRTAFTSAAGAIAANQGQITSTVTSARQTQVALRLNF
jgi:Carboxypeptidase regulatory-like domain/TonB-dependent Receptor Plug Domain